MLEQRLEEGEVGGDAADPVLAQRPVHARDRLLGRRRPGGDLLQHRVVVAGDHGTRIGGAAVDADAEAEGAAIGGDPAIVGDEVVLGVLGGDPALQRVAVEAHRVLGGDAGLGQRADPAALGDPDLRLHDVEAGHDLGHGVLDLDARVDLDEVEGAGVGIHQELDRAGADIVGGAADLERRLAQGRAALLVEIGGGRALDHLLVAALDGAVALEQVDQVAVACRPGAGPRRGARAGPASRDRPRPCRRRPWPRAGRRARRRAAAPRARSGACRARRRPRTP